ncbi:MAG: helix-turn-helix domain-containing protein [Longibaculum sp.]
MAIGSRIRKRREEMGMSQEELAKKLGYKSRSTINKIEKDINDITQSKILEFAKVLHTTPAYLMGWESDELTIENRPDALTENLEETVKYLKENEDDELLELYKELVSNESLVLLVKKASKLSPKDVAQLLRIVNAFEKETFKDE